MMEYSVAHTCFMDVPLFWIVNKKCFIRAVLIGSIFELVMQSKKLLLNIPLKSLNIFFISLIAGLLVGVGWEIFEFAIFKPLLLVDKEDYMRDTTIDLVMDISGALVAAWYFLLNVNR